MENNREETTPPPERDKILWTPPCIRISRLWKLRVTFYAVLFLAATMITYQYLVSAPLQSLSTLTLSPEPSIQSTYKEGIAVGYMMCYLLLAVLYLLESTICNLFYEDEREWELENISKKICLCMGITAVALAFTIPFLWP